jgi:hypothetical protein
MELLWDGQARGRGDSKADSLAKDCERRFLDRECDTEPSADEKAVGKGVHDNFFLLKKNDLTSLLEMLSRALLPFRPSRQVPCCPIVTVVLLLPRRTVHAHSRIPEWDSAAATRSAPISTGWCSTVASRVVGRAAARAVHKGAFVTGAPARRPRLNAGGGSGQVVVLVHVLADAADQPRVRDLPRLQPLHLDLPMASCRPADRQRPLRWGGWEAPRIPPQCAAVPHACRAAYPARPPLTPHGRRYSPTCSAIQAMRPLCRQCSYLHCRRPQSANPRPGDIRRMEEERNESHTGKRWAPLFWKRRVNLESLFALTHHLWNFLFLKVLQKL